MLAGPASVLRQHVSAETPTRCPLLTESVTARQARLFGFSIHASISCGRIRGRRMFLFELNLYARNLKNGNLVNRNSLYYSPLTNVTLRGVDVN